MSAYAALVTLMNIMDDIQNHPRVSTFFHEKQSESLRKKLYFLLDFEENQNTYGGTRKEVEDLEGQIASACHAAEIAIESHIVDQIHGRSTPDRSEESSRIKHYLQKGIRTLKNDITHKSPNFLLDLEKIMEDMDSIKEKVLGFENERGKSDKADQRPRSADTAATSRPLTAKKTSVVGFDGYRIQLLDWLTAGKQSDRQVIHITGMGGIGKTTLAKYVYENSLIMQHFDARAWATVTQDYSLIKLLSEILSCLSVSISAEDTDEQLLGEKLYKVLSGRRYLVVLDDMWITEVWSKIKFFFPKNDSLSRVVVTTRQLDVANHCGSLGLGLDFLNEERSWHLFHENAFGQEGCPPELEKIGKEIVRKCNGLPLSIVVVGGLLKKSSRTTEFWKNVEKDLSSILNSIEGNQLFNVLSLSYRQLPACLKPCFLYLGMFPEDHRFKVSQLVKLWAAEGFVKSNTDRSLEEVAEGYIKDLVGRNLVLVRTMHLNGTYKTCSVHDLLRDFCIKVAEKEKFPWVQLCGNYSLKPGFQRVMPNSSSILDPIFHHQVNLVYLKHTLGFHNTLSYKLPSIISQLWNLQTLVFIDGHVVVPSEIWEMPQLRHLCAKYLHILDLPLPPSDKRDVTVLQNLQTLQTVVNSRCSEDLYKRMPNIRKLRITFDKVEALSYDSHCNFGSLNKLEALLYANSVSDRSNLLQNLKFPDSLKKLTLGFCKLHWDDLAMVGSLPHLEVLKLYCMALGPEWKPIEGGFHHLKFLKLCYPVDLVSWHADESSFPALEKLVLELLNKLEEIPLGIGDRDTLRNISLNKCTVSMAVSAMRILEEQESLGNEGLRVEVTYSNPTYLEEFKKQLKT